jgi:uncharacterized short protein YbdD (DUF466 family)
MSKISEYVTYLIDYDVPVFKNHTDDDIMTLQEFQDSCSEKTLTNFDGYGHISNGSHHGRLNVLPSVANEIDFPKWVTHIVWYNK